MSNVDIANKFADKIKVFETAFMEEFMRRVAAKTPVRTGAAQRGYYIEEVAGVFYLKNTQDYVIYLEMGTEYIRPHAMVQSTMLEVDDIMQVAKQKAGL